MAKMLSFYDVRTKQKFNSDKYVLKTKSGKNFAIAVNPKSKGECWRIVGADVMGKPATKAKTKAKKK
jgi:hypothetical protein